MDRAIYKLYPNLYIILIGESATTKKSTAINIGTDILINSIADHVNIAADTETKASMVRDLCKRYEKTGISDVHIAAGEFVNFVGDIKSDTMFTKYISELWDCKARQKNGTIIRGHEVSNNIFCNMIAGSTEDWFKVGMAGEDIGGGFYSRLIPVPRDPSGRHNAHPEFAMTKSMWEAKENCIHDLRIIQGITGTFTWTNRARTMYEAWYEDEEYAVHKKPKQLRGYYGRKRDMVIKLSMILSSNFGSDMKIKETDLEYAWSVMGENEQYLGKMIKYLNTTPEGARMEKVLEYIQSKSPVKRRKLIADLSNAGVTAKFLDEELIPTHGQTGSGIIRMTQGSGVTYEYVKTRE